MMYNIMTVDVEDWYQTNDFNHSIDQYESFEDRIEKSTGKMLELLSRYNTKATFFILGCMAKKHPALIRKIAGEGHDIASHGTWHRMVGSLTPQEFRQDIRYSKDVLEDIIGTKVNFYRAPSWSISRHTLWALEALEEEGFVCDSSLQPFSTPLSGIKNAPVVPYHPQINGRALNLLEVPPTVLEIGPLRFPFAGGLYLRILPYPIILGALSLVNKKRAGLVYSHPWELDIYQPRLKVKPLIKFVHYYNLKSTEIKLAKLLQRFSFLPLGQFIKDKEFPVLPV